MCLHVCYQANMNQLQNISIQLIMVLTIYKHMGEFVHVIQYPV